MTSISDVLQGDVEAIASKTPKDLTLLIEQISGSDELRDKYETLKQEKDKAEENTIYNYQKKKGMNAEKKQFKAQKEEAEKFQKLTQDKVTSLQQICVNLHLSERTSSRTYFISTLSH